MNRFLLLLLGLMISSSSLQAQDDFQKFMQQYKSEFQEYKDKRDAEFAKVLKEAWQFVKINDAQKVYSKPKIVTPPKAEPKPIADSKNQPKNEIKVEPPAKEDLPPSPPPKPAPKPEPEKKSEDVPSPKSTKTPEPKPIVKPEPKNVETPVVKPVERPVSPPPSMPADPVPSAIPMLKASYFQISASFPVDPKMKEARISSYKADDIAKYWDAMSRTNYEPLINQVKQRQADEALNDWAVGYMVESLAREIYGSDKSNQALFLWFVFNKLGYDTKVGFNDSGIYLMAPTDYRLFGIKYFMINGQRYYVLRFSELGVECGALYTYKGNYPESTQKIRFGITDYPKIPEKMKERALKFSYANKDYTVNVTYNSAMLDFFKVYPQADLPVYFRAPASSSATKSMVDGLKPIIDGKSEWDKVNIILRFVQSAFAYKTDDDQFGREKYFFVEETLGYPFSDCEDRSILFAYLINELTGNEVVGLKYPGHLATAVKFNDAVGGDQLKLNGSTYTVCDPTYVNADIGMTMPQFKGKAPKVIQFR